MKITVRLESLEVQNILMKHIEEKFDSHKNKGEYLETMRVGEPAPAFEATVESKQPSPNAWD